jgi:hypothetical protein
LSALQERRSGATARLAEVEAEARTSALAAQQASEALIAHEREGGSATKRRELERALADARAKAGEPWAERRQAAALAVEDARVALSAYAQEHADELLEDVAVRGRAAAAAVDAAAQAVRDAYALRQQVEAETFALLALAGSRNRPGDVRSTRAEAIAAECERLLMQGGEAWPEVLARPGQPRHPVAEVEEPEGAVA